LVSKPSKVKFQPKQHDGPQKTATQTETPDTPSKAPGKLNILKAGFGAAQKLTPRRDVSPVQAGSDGAVKRMKSPVSGKTALRGALKPSASNQNDSVEKNTDVLRDKDAVDKKKMCVDNNVKSAGSLNAPTPKKLNMNRVFPAKEEQLPSSATTALETPTQPGKLDKQRFLGATGQNAQHSSPRSGISAGSKKADSESMGTGAAHQAATRVPKSVSLYDVGEKTCSAIPTTKSESDIKVSGSSASQVAPSGQEFLTLEQLRKTEVCHEYGVDLTQREMRLSEADFKEAFHMSCEDFLKLPKWKRDRQKVQLGIF